MLRITQASACAGMAARLLNAEIALASPPAKVPTLDGALAQLQSEQPAAAATSLRVLTVMDPRNAAAWRALGLAELMLTHFDAAIVDFQHTLSIQADSPHIFYKLGDAYAEKHDSEHAFEWLSRAQASHRYDMTEISADLHLVGLRSDPRFNTLLPSPADFEQPFVEPVKIIREWHGEAKDDQFGWIARNVGDVDGDSITDIVTSAPTHGGHTGRIYVYSVGTGKLLWTADGAPGDELGSGVEGIGDANGDGIPDVAASGPSAAGVAYI